MYPDSCVYLPAVFSLKQKKRIGDRDLKEFQVMEVLATKCETRVMLE